MRSLLVGLLLGIASTQMERLSYQQKAGNNPLSLATEFDCSNFMAFLGQVRDRLVLFLADRHERIVPEILDWELTQCDMNKDIRIEKWLQTHWPEYPGQAFVSSLPCLYQGKRQGYSVQS